MKTNFDDLKSFFKKRTNLYGPVNYICSSLLFGKETSAKVADILGAVTLVKVTNTYTCETKDELAKFNELLSEHALQDAGAKVFEGTGRDNIYWIEDQKLLLVFDGEVDYLFTFYSPN